MISSIFIFFSNIRKYGFIFFFNVLLSEQLHNIREDDYFYPSDILKGKKIAIYGFGHFGKVAFIDFIFTNKITSIYDKNFSSFKKNIRDPNTISPNEFDYIILSVMNKKAVISILDFFNDKKIEKKKIIQMAYSIKNPS